MVVRPSCLPHASGEIVIGVFPTCPTQARRRPKGKSALRFAAGERCVFFVGWAELEGVAVQDGSQLGQALVLEQAWVVRELFDEGIQHLPGMGGDLLHHLVDVSCANNV